MFILIISDKLTTVIKTTMVINIIISMITPVVEIKVKKMINDKYLSTQKIFLNSFMIFQQVELKIYCRVNTTNM